MKKIIAFFVLFVAIGIIVLQFINFEYAYVPDEDEVKSGKRALGELQLIAEEGPTSMEQIELGKEMFFKETFGNEVFFTDILGMFDGAFTFKNLMKALIQLKGEGTTNLQVEAAESFKAGNVSIKKGELINTGLDVAKGSYTPLGVNIVMDEGRLKAGISCAACHASVDNEGTVIPGIPNTDLNIGLHLAMGTNTASYFSHTEMDSLKKFITDKSRTVETSSGKKEALPNPEKLEQFVDSEMVKWPLGSNDTTIDFKNNPVQVPDSFTLGDHPYGWSGQGQIGPFKGLSAAINNAHAQNMDALSQSEIAAPVKNIDKEIYLGTILQNAANKKYRYDYLSKEKPSEFFATVDPTPEVPGVNELIKSATYPKISYVTSIGLFSSSPKFNAWEQINAMSAYMNTLHPPKTNERIDNTLFEEGQLIFQKAGCIRCHGGEFYTNNKLIQVEDIKTDPSRAAGFNKTEKFFADPKLYTFDTPVPLPENPETINLEMSKEQEQQLKLGWAHENKKGAYKTISLFGLYWSAPYLHDGGVSVGANDELGLPKTLMNGIKADPYKSLEALIDSSIRQKVIKSNLASEAVRSAHMSGKGHEHWVDETTGFTKKQQEALIHYLIHLTD